MRRTTLAISLAVAATSLASAMPVFADSSDSSRVGDLQYGNALDPTGWALLQHADPRGFSWLHPYMLRTPSGALYPYAPTPQDSSPLNKDSDWVWSGSVQAGFVHVGGDRNAEFFRQYADWRSGFVLGLLWLQFDNPTTGSYAEVRGSHIGPDDQYYRLRAGQYGRYKVQAFWRDIPHTVAANAYPLWNGVGSENLTVPAPLVPGGSTPAEVAAVDRTRPRDPVRLTRRRAGLSYEGKLYRDWIGFASVVNEKRTGTRLWGGPMFFNYPFADNGGALETVRPIDFTTTDVNLGLRDVGAVWQFQIAYTGSFFRNHQRELDFQSPFSLYNVVGVPQVANIYQGQFSLEPNNDYHNLSAELSRRLKWNGHLSLKAAWGTMRQNDQLLAPVTCSGIGGIDIAPPANFTFKCADWNTAAALSQQTAEARIDTGLLQAKAVFHPTAKFGWHAGVRWYREDNKTNYLAYNPLTGQYGYISENGSQGSIVPGEAGFYDPNNPLFWSAETQIRSIPFGYVDTLADVGIDWRFNDSNTLNVTYSFDRNQPKHRERQLLNEQRIRLQWVDRALGKATLRLSYEFGYRDGGPYDYDPYESAYSSFLPGFKEPPIGLAAFTTDAMRKYDMSNRIEQKMRGILIYPIGDTATLSGVLYGTHDNYAGRDQVGRQSTRNYGLSVAYNWQPTASTNLGLNIGRDDSRLKFANVADNEAIIGASAGQQDPSLGGPLYPLANLWQDIDSERDYNAGVTFNQNFGRVRMDVEYAYTYSLSKLRFNYATPSAISGTQQPYVGSVGHGFPNNHYRTQTLQLGFDIALNRQVGVRVFDRLQTGSFFDWHYAGLEDNLVIDHKIYTDAGPHRHYTANLVGLMLNVKL